MVSVPRVVMILTGCLALAGCEGDDPGIVKDPPPGETGTGHDKESAGGEKSGTRLRARYTVGSDGSREFVGWHDKQRGEDCTFKTAEMGRTRCMPAAHPVFDYSDPECTQPIVTLPPALDCNGNPPKYIQALDYSDPCVPKTRLFEMGKATTAMMDPVYRSTPQGCEAVGAGAMAVFYEIGAEVPMTELVEGSVVME